jgi:predicted ribosome quality control (RQC) complex YloA/Tae2 family protein
VTFAIILWQGFKSVGYSNLVPVVVEAIKEQQRIIEQNNRAQQHTDELQQQTIEQLRQTNEQQQQTIEQQRQTNEQQQEALELLLQRVAALESR